MSKVEIYLIFMTTCCVIGLVIGLCVRHEHKKNVEAQRKRQYDWRKRG